MVIELDVVKEMVTGYTELAELILFSCKVQMS